MRVFLLLPVVRVTFHSAREVEVAGSEGKGREGKG